MGGVGDSLFSPKRHLDDQPDGAASLGSYGRINVSGITNCMEILAASQYNRCLRRA